jgi:hypothetical protein
VNGAGATVNDDGAMVTGLTDDHEGKETGWTDGEAGTATVPPSIK